MRTQAIRAIIGAVLIIVAGCTATPTNQRTSVCPENLTPVVDTRPGGRVSCVDAEEYLHTDEDWDFNDEE